MTENRVNTFVLTGATGFLGSHLLAALLQRGDRVVVLGRRSERESLAERIKALLDWFGLVAFRDQVEIVEVDLLKLRCGLDPTQYETLCKTAGSIIHCASDTRFSEKNRQASIATNVDSLREIIKFAKDSNAPWFHYVSTAYAAGIASSSCPEALVTSGVFVNVYEETKACAENEVAARCTAQSIPFTILRPSVVYGDSRTGRANRFNALYTHVKALYFIRDIYLKDLREHGGCKSKEYDIYLDKDRILHLPLKVVVDYIGHINLIPIDYFIAAALSIMEHAKSGTIYNMTSDAPKTVGNLASYCESFLSIRGVEIVYRNSVNAAFNPPEALFNRFIASYLPYLSDTRTFVRKNTDEVTGGLTPPEFTYDIFARCMEYAASVNWGR